VRQGTAHQGAHGDQTVTYQSADNGRCPALGVRAGHRRAGRGSVVVAAPRLGVDDAAVAAAEGGGVAVVVPHVGATVLVDVVAGVAPGAGVDPDGGPPLQAQVAETVGVTVTVRQGPALQVDGAAGSVGDLDPFGVQAADRAGVASGAVVLNVAERDRGLRRLSVVAGGGRDGRGG